MSTDNNKDALSFEEFSALRRRNRAMQRTVEKASKQDDELNSSATVKDTFLERVGKQLESQEIQFFVLVLTALDLAGTIATLLLQSKAIVLSEELSTAATQLIEYQSGFCNSAYIAELVALVCVFRGKILTHFGYMGDILSFGVVLAFSIRGGHSAIRLLGIFRAWRVLRIVNSMIASVESDHEVTKAALAESLEQIEDEKQRTKQAQLERKREVQKHHRMEESFRAQQEELETLREALSIAALTVAEAQGYPGDQTRNDSTSTKSGRIQYTSSMMKNPKNVIGEESKGDMVEGLDDDASDEDDDTFHDTKELARIDEGNETGNKISVSVA